MADSLSNEEIDLALKIALQTLARAALKQLVEARGVGGWLDQLEEHVMLALKNRSFPGVPMERERGMIEIAESAVRTLIRDARGDGTVMILD